MLYVVIFFFVVFCFFIFCFLFFFFNDTATTEIYTLSLTTLFRSNPKLPLRDGQPNELGRRNNHLKGLPFWWSDLNWKLNHILVEMSGMEAVETRSSACLHRNHAKSRTSNLPQAYEPNEWLGLKSNWVCRKSSQPRMRWFSLPENNSRGLRFCCHRHGYESFDVEQRMRGFARLTAAAKVIAIEVSRLSQSPEPKSYLNLILSPIHFDHTPGGRRPIDGEGK